MQTLAFLIEVLYTSSQLTSMRRNLSSIFSSSLYYHLYTRISDTLSLDVELDKHIGKAATMFSRPTKRGWLNKKLTAYTKIQVYRAYVLSSLLYCSESWTLCARQERKLNTFHMCCLRWIFGITWQDKVPNRVVLERARIFSMYTLLKQRYLRWLGHVVRMADV